MDCFIAFKLFHSIITTDLFQSVFQNILTHLSPTSYTHEKTDWGLSWENEGISPDSLIKIITIPMSESSKNTEYFKHLIKTRATTFFES